MLHDLIRIWFEWVHDWGYWGVFILMALESTVVPVPSEIVMPPAAFWAAQGGMSFWGVVAAGGAGSYVGSALSYWVCRWLGQTLLPRYGRYVLLTEEKIVVASLIIQRYGTVGVFLARLLPVVRHLISIPAGILKMGFLRFSVVTALGATLWCWILALWGQRVLGAHPELLESPAEMMTAIKAEMIWFVAAIVGFGILYAGVVMYRRRNVVAVSASPSSISPSREPPGEA